MQIIHKIDDFLFTIFPKLMGGGNLLIINTLEKYYSIGPYKPKVTIENDWVNIEIDAPTIISQEADYRKTVALCEKGKYSEAKPILTKLLEKNPTNSEYHRIMGQILSDEGDQDEAIGCLIDALRWDSKNGWALMMMGNIFSKFKKDVPTAMKYYDHALVANPNDFITINNIGVNLMQQGQTQEARKYFLEALKINGQYANTHHALGMIAELGNDLPAAFDSTIQAIKFNKNKDVLYQNSVKLAFEIAGRLTKSNAGKYILEEYKDKLIAEGGTEIEIIEDPEIQTAAKFEFAENYNRQKHIIRFKPKYTATEHLIIHELVHLDFVIEARKKNLNQIFFSDKTHKALFQNELESSANKLRKMEIPEESITNFCNGLFSMINSQIFNTPVDLFIENFLYHQYLQLRPYQFLSLISMTDESMKAVTDEQVINVAPKNFISKSKIYSLVNAIQLKELYGLDFISDFKATPAELTQAQEFYGEFAQYKDDREPAEEYELVMNWAEDLKLNKFFELEGEIQYRKRGDMDTFFKSLEEDPLGIDDPDPVKEREMQKFLKNHQKIGINMAVAMFMVEALRYFDEMPKQKIKKIAAEIALQGTQGYNPEKKDYTISSIPGKLFSGFHILAWYYVSFAIALPELLSQLQLPYDAEYKYALTMTTPN